MLGEEAQRVRV